MVKNMKRSREVSIIIDALVAEKLLCENETEKARPVIKEAIKKIRMEAYEEKRSKNGSSFNCRWTSPRI